MCLNLPTKHPYVLKALILTLFLQKIKKINKIFFFFIKTFFKWHPLIFSFQICSIFCVPSTSFWIAAPKTIQSFIFCVFNFVGAGHMLTIVNRDINLTTYKERQQSQVNILTYFKYIHVLGNTLRCPADYNSRRIVHLKKESICFFPPQ